MSNVTTREERRRAAKIRAESRRAAAESGELPHDWLLRVARGECVKQRRLEIVLYKSGARKGEIKEKRWVEEDYYPSFPERVDAAKSAAPFFAPKLASQVIKSDESTTANVAKALVALADKLPG